MCSSFARAVGTQEKIFERVWSAIAEPGMPGRRSCGFFDRTEEKTTESGLFYVNGATVDALEKFGSVG